MKTTNQVAQVWNYLCHINHRREELSSGNPQQRLYATKLYRIDYDEVVTIAIISVLKWLQDMVLVRKKDKKICQ
jgi:hypothetical protein